MAQDKVTSADLEAQSAAELPAREAMTLIDPGVSGGPAPLGGPVPLESTDPGLVQPDDPSILTGPPETWETTVPMETDAPVVH